MPITPRPTGSNSRQVDTVYDFTGKGLKELESWLEPWFKKHGGGIGVQWEDVGVGCSGWASYEEVLRMTGGLVGYWKLDDAIDFEGTFTSWGSDWHNHDNWDFSEYQDGVVTDSSGLNNHFMYVRATEDFVPDTDIALVSGYADLPGGASPQGFLWVPSVTTAGCEISHTGWSGITTPVQSVSFWFKTPATGTPSGVLIGTHEVSSGGGGFGANFGWAATLGGVGSSMGTTTPGQISVSYGNNSNPSVVVLEGPHVANDTWYHLAITSDGTTNTLYVNGINVDTYTGVGNILADYTRLKFGVYGYKSGFQWLVGWASGIELDEIAMWTETVTEHWAAVQAGVF